MGGVDGQVVRNENPQTPSGPEGSSGSGVFRVPCIPWSEPPLTRHVCLFMSSYVVLARRWRPRTFEALVGQTHVTKALTHALATGQVSHAFLFSGIRGVGKTTLARLLAMCLNCENGVSPNPCGQCSSCSEIIAGNHPDVFEVDAASRTKVEQMREILDMVGYAPAVSRYKIFILDEVHMLSTQSFNALLKTLEEPPSHVKFLFATTESRKIPVTILSRCQRYDLKRVSRDLLMAHLVSILEKEGTSFDTEGLAAVVRASEGSVRDALSLLDQVISHGAGEVRFGAVQDLLGLTDQEGIFRLLACLLHGKGKEALESAANFYNNGVEPESIAKELLAAIHQVTRDRFLGTQAGVPDNPQDQEGSHAIISDVSLEHLQMAYQVVLRGTQDLHVAEDALQALEMLLLRVAYLKPVPHLEKMLASLQGSGSPPVVPLGSAKTVSSPSSATRAKEAVRARPSMGLSSATSSAKEAVRAWPPVGFAQKDGAKERGKNSAENGGGPEGSAVGSGRFVPEWLTSWEHLVSSAAENDVGLGLKLKTQLSCLVFHVDPSLEGDQAEREASPSRIVLRLAKDFLGSPDYFRQLLETFLASRGVEGVHVVVEAVSDASRPKTIEETASSVQRERQNRLNQRVENHPVVRRMVSRFQAKIIRVEPVVGTEVEGPVELH